MKRHLFSFCLVLAGLVLVLNLCIQAEEAIVGKPAPNFSQRDLKGQTHSLANYKGKIIVLEWLNHDCPYVRKHYNSGNMQKLQKTYTKKGIVWLSVISSAPGKQGYCTPEEASKLTKTKNANPTAVLLDPEGIVGKKYGAKTTPQMFIINAEGILVYNGGIDDKPSAKVEDIEKARNLVQLALDELLAGKEVTVKTSRPYGCSVKYSN